MTSPTRERLLRTAADLFYAEGVGAVGVERLCQTAGVSKRSMYQLFATKDDLVAEALRVHGPATVAHYFAPEDAGLTPRERILHVFGVLEEQAAAPGFHGCPFANTTIELHDATHQASRVALEFKQQLEVYFQRQAALLGARDPQQLGTQLLIVFDGASVRAVMRGGGIDGVATRTAGMLLDAFA
ncbi:TetR/AcrR family transcriptional regulator [Dactylosporangium sp. NBC_01737]|uniref:TetR/AcrR family transcriptional regulator n=1 Tax=Dactylosporangium sp. NBC_01737 TaxID=2975959 RepID=UPI002E0E6163|nr:TetR/AcrR family transcriptional regulator [Dactylosporangium sp. NBC_01737]